MALDTGTLFAVRASFTSEKKALLHRTAADMSSKLRQHGDHLTRPVETTVTLYGRRAHALVLRRSMKNPSVQLAMMIALEYSKKKHNGTTLADGGEARKVNKAR
jgi:hypothetical protein